MPRFFVKDQLELRMQHTMYVKKSVLHFMEAEEVLEKTLCKHFVQFHSDKEDKK